ncbi:hypothetical protein TD95_003291 [Thielaviopsis punctulata]|uniref:Amino acid permease/ SLC12A domain-containing protein n=1 Tax=Thielaviopsis punctulata TaxID=72032 RepID=A0A0F4ZBR8_9PEZI|nr:hypothetical protein TD95_003291 [Thielaviopsis punctulata]
MSGDEVKPLLARTSPFSSSSSPILEHGPSPVPSRALDDEILPETSATGRQLGWSDTYLLIMSRVFGSGIFATPGAIVRAVGSPGLALLLWLVGAVVAACGVAISLELGMMLPRSGGEKVYLEYTWRKPRFLIGTLYAVYIVFLGFTAGNAVIFSRYMLFALGLEDASEWLRKGLAAGLLTVVVVIHTIWPGRGVWIQSALARLKLSMVFGMIVCGFYAVLSRSITVPENPLDVPNRASALSALFNGSVWEWGAISPALFQVFYSYAGLETANSVMNEIKNPVQTLRSASIAALATCCLLFLLTNVAYLCVVPIEEIKNSGEMIAALYFERLFGSSIGRRLLPLVIAVSAGGNVMVVAYSMGRLKQEIARQGLLPYANVFASSAPFRSPLGAFIIHWVTSVLVIVSPPSEKAFKFVLEVEGYPAQIFALITAVSLLKLRHDRPSQRRPFKAWLPTVYLRGFANLLLLSPPFFPPKEQSADDFWYASYAVVSVGM